MKNTDPGDDSSLWYPIKSGKKGLRRRFAANSISDAASNINIKTE
jgi:hypothetical protein